MHVARGVGVEADEVGAGLGKGGGQRIDRPHHQVHVDRHGHAGGGLGVGLEGLADHGAEREVGHIVVVHHVEVDPVGAGGDDVVHFVAQAGEIGRQNRGGNAVGAAHAPDCRSYHSPMVRLDVASSHPSDAPTVPLLPNRETANSVAIRSICDSRKALF